MRKFPLCGAFDPAIDFAETSLKGLRSYMAEGGAVPVEVPPPQSPRIYRTRRGIAEWLVERLAEDAPALGFT